MVSPPSLKPKTLLKDLTLTSPPPQDVNCSPGISWIKLYDDKGCLDPPNQVLMKPSNKYF